MGSMSQMPIVVNPRMRSVHALRLASATREARELFITSRRIPNDQLPMD